MHRPGVKRQLLRVLCTLAHTFSIFKTTWVKCLNFAVSFSYNYFKVRESWTNPQMPALLQEAQNKLKRRLPTEASPYNQLGEATGCNGAESWEQVTVKVPTFCFFAETPQMNWTQCTIHRETPSVLRGLPLYRNTPNCSVQSTERHIQS